MTDFLRAGNKIKLVVGVDLNNTSVEGLRALLALTEFGDISCYVHHNEFGTVFHPKIYMFTNDQDAKLIVGSNNITQSGLYQNTEAGLEVDLPRDHPTIIGAKNAIEAWCEIESGLAKPLTEKLVEDLIAGGYIKDEKTLSVENIKAQQTRKDSKRKKLFATVPFTPPAPNKEKSPKTPAAQIEEDTASTTGQVLIMRIRKAHATDRPTQTQIPKSVASRPFFGGINRVTSTHTGEEHEIHEAQARGIINTLKLEIPEMRKFSDPVIRFEREGAQIRYEVYDSNTPKGSAIMKSLNEGLKMTPKTTKLTKPSDPEKSTWSRFI
jgi:hypothetical protein